MELLKTLWPSLGFIRDLFLTPSQELLFMAKIPTPYQFWQMLQIRQHPFMLIVVPVSAADVVAYTFVVKQASAGMPARPCHLEA